MTTPGDPTPQDPATAPEDRQTPAPADVSAAAPAPVDLTKPHEPAAAPSDAPAPEPPVPGQPYAGQPYGQDQPYGQNQPYAPGPQPYGQGQPYPVQPYAGQPYPPAYAYPKNQLAVWSLVLGIIGIVVGCVFVTGIPAVIVGNSAKRAVAAGEADNLGMAQAGIVLGWISIALGVVVLGFFALYFIGVVGVVGLSFLSAGGGV